MSINEFSALQTTINLLDRELFKLDVANLQAVLPEEFDYIEEEFQKTRNALILLKELSEYEQEQIPF